MRPSITEEEIAEVAAFLHDSYRRGRKRTTKQFAKLSVSIQMDYRAVAAALLTTPPEPLRRIREKANA